MAHMKPIERNPCADCQGVVKVMRLVGMWDGDWLTMVDMVLEIS